MQAKAIWKRFRRRIRYWLNHSERQRQLWEEMEFHVSSMVAELVAQGMPEPEARVTARRRFGNMTQKSEEARSTWIARWISDLMQDLRHSFRSMRRDVGFTAFTILIAGLGIGASSTVFSVVNALLLRPLPFRHAEELVWVSNGGWSGEEFSTQVSHFLDLKQLNRSFVDMAAYYSAYKRGNRQLTGTGEPERVTAIPVTQNFLPMLGIDPVIGRSFVPEECTGQNDAPLAVILSYGFWQRRFAADRSIVGQKLILNNLPTTIVGVLPASFDFANVFDPGASVDILVPFALTEQVSREGNNAKIIGRIRPGIGISRAQAEFSTLAKQLVSHHPERNPVDPVLSPLKQHVSGQMRPALGVLMWAVGAVMLIVCANLSNLLLARMSSRHKELVMRAALGAGRSRLLRQILTEGVTLSCCGAALGLVLAIAGTRELAHLHAFNLPLIESVRIDGKALIFTLLAAVGTGLLLGVLPALRLSAVSLSDQIQDAGRGSIGGGRGAWIRDGLVVSELAFACVLLVSAGLLIRSFVRVLDVDLGFQPERAAALRVDPSFRITSLDQQNAYTDELLRHARAVPGINAAGLTDAIPLASDRSWSVAAKGQVYPKGHTPEAFMRVVSDGYFEAAGVRLLAGREFTDRDRASSEPVVMVNQTLARTLWPSQDPVGKMVTQNGGRRVVGVVADVRHAALEKASGSEMYIPLRQTRDYSSMELVMRSSLPPDTMAASIRRALRQVDPNLPIGEFRTLQALVDQAVSPRRFLVLLLAGFAGFALLLASLGIYAVVSYSVSQRVQEIGIRMALGASARDVQRRVLMRTLELAAAGLFFGMAGARILSGALSSLLFGITSGDSATFFAIGVLLAGVALVAGYIPAWRASRIDPMVALRSN
ncbi:MAG TPA: ABC transporter permease [Bryobacteraceae bacterium]|nr:ABC transporter permease [Bryobacteraceae bacterium]